MMRRYCITTLLLYSVILCINIDAWSSLKRFRHLWQPNINRVNESLSLKRDPLNSLKGKLQSINFQNSAPSQGGREKRRKYKDYHALMSSSRFFLIC